MRYQVQRYQVQKSPGVGGHPIPDDEPCLVIRAQDVFAPVMMRIYMALYIDVEEHDPEVMEELRDHLDKIQRWQGTHPLLVKLADR